MWILYTYTYPKYYHILILVDRFRGLAYFQVLTWPQVISTISKVVNGHLTLVKNSLLVEEIIFYNIVNGFICNISSCLTEKLLLTLTS